MRPLDSSLISQGSSTIGFVKMLGGATGVSLCGIVLELRLSAHNVALSDGASDSSRIAAFGEAFLMLTLLCGLALVAAWQPRPSAENATASGGNEQ